MKGNNRVLVEMTDHTVLDLWMIHSGNYFHGMELCLEPWIRYGVTPSMVFTMDKDLIMERVRMLDGEFKVWKDIEEGTLREIWCMTIHPKERLWWLSEKQQLSSSHLNRTEGQIRDADLWF